MRSADRNRRRRAYTTVEISDDSVRGLRDLDTVQLEVLLCAAFREYGTRFPPHEDPPLPMDAEYTDTTDLSLATYYGEGGLILLGLGYADEPHSWNKASFRFVGSKGAAEKLRMAYARSPAFGYDSRMRLLKKMAHEGRREMHGGH